jgi:hypothetical protein
VIGLDIIEAASVPNTDEYHRVDLLDATGTGDCFRHLGDIDAILNMPWACLRVTPPTISGT